jgi:hypothetical protein
VCLGIDWHEDMYRTRSDGIVRISGRRVGGHFLTIIGYDVHPSAGECVLWINSWGPGYGVAHEQLAAPGGIGFLPVESLATLLASDGEAVIPADFLAPIPTPPPDPDPPPLPNPSPPKPSWWEWFRRLWSR